MKNRSEEGDAMADPESQATALATASAHESHSRHTAGPWRIDRPSEIGGCLDVRSRHFCIASIHAGMDDSWPHRNTQRDANARLIAAAPDLLAACIKVVEHYGDPAGGQLFGLRAAIAKATGHA